MNSNQYRLFYVHDPMCSWCWGFQKTWQQVHSNLTNSIDIQYIVGGLAPDSDLPMPEAQQQAIAGYWRTIQTKIPGTEFNFDFWSQCSPRRSTYPACRAVLAAKTIEREKETDMIAAIQHAYYLQAQNPSNIDTLIACAEKIGLKKTVFEHTLKSDEIETLFQEQLQLANDLGARGFPSLILTTPQANQSILIDYNNPSFITQQVMANISA